MIGEAFLEVPVNTPIKLLIDGITEPCVGPVDQFFGARFARARFPRVNQHLAQLNLRSMASPVMGLT
jgi:hypothetical protein